MTLTPALWHRRFQQQATWTEPTRRYLLSRLNIQPGARILEAGCGTGVIISSLIHEIGYTHATVCGLDFNQAFLSLAQRQNQPGRFTCGNALDLPFPQEAFDVTACHYFLLWISDPETALAEMVRVTRLGGAVIAFAEPDYGGRIDYPAQLVELGQMQSAALRDQGADPEMGRKLSGIFHSAGLHNVEIGVLAGQWQAPPSPEALDLEWQIIKADLHDIPVRQLQSLRNVDSVAWRSGARVLFVPTFYAVGWK